ncbi:Serine/threonine-protein kinase PrkC [Planctomycetes bacterium MalM25]|nr:Serine/threonine-protein kinase PrkC [Planctomycetes bacterium MalM25]
MKPDDQQPTIAAEPTAEQIRLVEALDRYVVALERGEAEPIEQYAALQIDLDADQRRELVDCLEGVVVIHEAVESARRDPPDESDSVGHDPVVDPFEGEPRQIGDYRLVREIGRGGMGLVYEAEELSLRRRVALKMLPFAAVLDQRQITRFRNEAQAAAGLHHSNIVPVFAIGQERGVHYYAMQYIEGRSLAQAIAELRRDDSPRASTDATTETAPAISTTPREPSPTPVATLSVSPSVLGETNRTTSFFRAAARLGEVAADALAHAHGLGVVHRDVKPSNLLIDERGEVWVADFGLARMQTDLGVTATGDVVGTLRYMSPEQARGRADQIDGRTDVYALGATLYELLTLRHAHPGEDRRRLLDRLERVDPIPPRKHNPAIPADLENIVLRAMEKDRDARYASAGELRDDLRRFLDGKPTIARPPTLWERGVKWANRRRQAVAVAAAVMALVTAISVVSGVMVNTARHRAEAALAESEVQRQHAERSLDRALSVLDRFGSQLSDQLAATPGAEPVRDAALRDALASYQEFLDQSSGDPVLAASVAKTRVHAAAVAERLGRGDKASRLYTQAIEDFEALHAEAPDQVEHTRWLARSLNNHGLLLHDRDEATAALAELDRAVALQREVVKRTPGEAEALSDLAATLTDRAGLAGVPSSAARRDLDGATELLRRALKLAPEGALPTRRLAVAQNALASLLRTSDPKRAAAASDQAIELLTGLVDADPENDAYRDDLAIVHSNRGALAASGAHWDEAAESYGAAARELRRLAERAPRVPRRRSELAVALASRGFVLAQAEAGKASDAAFAEAEGVLRGLIAAYPKVEKYQTSLAALLNNRGVALRDSERLDEAAVAFARSTRLEERRLRSNRTDDVTLLDVHYANHAQVLGRLGRYEEAAEVESKREALLARRQQPHVTGTDGRALPGGQP